MTRLVLEALTAVGAIVAQSLVGGIIAVINALVYSQGFFWTGKSPAHQTRTEFIAAHMASLHVFFAVFFALGYSIPLGTHRWIQRPEHAPSQFFWFARLLQVSRMHLVVSGALILGISIASARVNERWRSYSIHFCPNALVVQYYMAVLTVAARTLYRTETVEGMRTRPRSKPAASWKRILRACLSNIGFLAAVYGSAVYIHLSSRLQLEKQETFVVFSVTSIAFRLLVMKMLFWVAGRQRRIHVRELYVLAAVPTAMISTQVRVALLRVSGNVSTTCVVVLAVIEPLFRVVKVWRLLLQFTAAELHADMCSEYIAIACSLAIFYCLNGHPKYAWPVQPQTSSTRRLELVLLQIAVELVVDTLCCLWELMNGIPLRTSAELNRFLMGLFVGCAVTNIGVSCSIYIK